jgi:pimeloyl-ACP methyl ester carboxylesterase
MNSDADIAHVLSLPDGRGLAWREYGDPGGAPCIYITGTPGSGLYGAAHSPAAAAAGVRWISIDKPGYGLSDFHPKRTLLDTATDVRALADHLRLGSFAVAGESGGGPHTLAVAYRLPERVTTAIVVAGMGPGDDPAVREGMKPQNKLLFGLAQRAPWALGIPMASMRRRLRNPAKAEELMRKQMATVPACDRESFNDPEFAPIAMAATADAFRHGSRGAVQEMQIFCRPWGFRIEDIAVHVDLWHGELDANVPVAVARKVAAALKDCDAHIVAEQGHSIGRAHLGEIMAAVRARA